MLVFSKLIKHPLLLLPLLSLVACTPLKETLWVQIYKKGVSKTTGKPTPYCTMTTAGKFIGTVSKQLAHGNITDKNIELSNFTFHQTKISNDSYHLTGTALESHLDTNHPWQDTITYDLFKKSEQGKTTGTWTNSQCKGTYVGYAQP